MTSLAPFAAPCVRACALRSALLRAPEWEAVGRLRTVDEIIEWFKGREVLPPDVADTAGAERAAHQAVIHCSTALLRFAQGDLANLLRCFLNYYDLLNLQSVVQRIHAMTASAHAVPFNTGVMGIIDEVTADATNFAALSRLLRGTRFAAAYEAGLVRYYEEEDVARLIESIEVAFFGEWVAAAEACGFSLKKGTDGSGLAVFLVERIVESAIRLKFHREADNSRIVEWLSLIVEPKEMDACLKILSDGREGPVALALAARVLPSDLLAKAGLAGREGDDALAGLRGMVLRRVLKAGRGIVFSVDFLSSFLVLQTYQALEMTALLESTELGLSGVHSIYREVAA